jgi:Family of unknown function (DUF5681)
MAGRPRGVENKDKPIRDALRIVAAEDVTITEGEGKHQRLRKLRKDRRVAEVLFLAAMSGDVAAIREISDRLDGRVAMAAEIKAKVEYGKILNDIVDP